MFSWGSFVGNSFQFSERVEAIYHKSLKFREGVGILLCCQAEMYVLPFMMRHHDKDIWGWHFWYHPFRTHENHIINTVITNPSLFSSNALTHAIATFIYWWRTLLLSPCFTISQKSITNNLGQKKKKILGHNQKNTLLPLRALLLCSLWSP